MYPTPRNWHRLIVSAALAATAYSCATGTEPVNQRQDDQNDQNPQQGEAVSTVQVTGFSAALAALGETVQLTGTAKDASGTTVSGKTATWSSSDDAVATVSNSGLVTAVSNGMATISATVEGKTGTVDATVSQVATKLTFTAEPGDTEQDVIVFPAVVVAALDARDHEATNFSDNITVALAANPGSASLGGATSVVAASGVATFDNLSLDQAAAGYTLEASASGLAPAVSREFEIMPPATAGVWTQVSVGGSHTCGLRTGGKAYCWGSDVHQQLGTGTGGPLRRPEPVVTDLRFQQITAGDAHTCGIAVDGKAYCWGRNQYGVLGTGTNELASSVPVAVVGGLTFKKLAAGMLRGMCGIVSDDTVYCWGSNAFGALGDGTKVDRNVPTAVTGAFKWLDVGMYLSHSCGLTVDGQSYCWGRNDNGQLGNGTLNDSSLPVAVTDGAGLTAIAVGLEFSCGVRDNPSGLICWGDNSVGQLGDSTFVDALTPSGVNGVAMAQVDGGGAFACGLTADNKAYCWGTAGFGQLGIGPPSNDRYNTPQLVVGGHQFESISVAGHACAITTAGDLYCWGFNESGQLGDASQINKDAPVLVREVTK